LLESVLILLQTKKNEADFIDIGKSHSSRERMERGCQVTNTDARNVTRNSLSFLALQSMMLGKRSAQNGVGKNWNNSSRLFRQKPPERVSEVRKRILDVQVQMLWR